MSSGCFECREVIDDDMGQAVLFRLDQSPQLIIPRDKPYRTQEAISTLPSVRICERHLKRITESHFSEEPSWSEARAFGVYTTSLGCMSHVFGIPIRGFRSNYEEFKDCPTSFRFVPENILRESVPSSVEHILNLRNRLDYLVQR